MTDIHADAPEKDVTRPADRAGIARLDGRIDRSEDRFLQAFAEIRGEIAGLRKDVQKLARWQWTAAGAAGLAVIVVSAALRFWSG